jgi:DNA-binding beta-propeller fold protein YncE
MALTPDGSTVFAVNFNLHGDPVPSSVSAVFTPFMAEASQIETCVRPHGSRMSHDGLNHYSGCLLSDQLVEISTAGLEVRRRLRLTDGHEGPVDDAGAVVDDDGACRPSWVVVSPDDRTLYVTCNARAEILEIDRSSFEIRRRFATGIGPYNAAMTGDGSLLVATLKASQAVAIVDVRSGSEHRVATSRPVTHGVVVSPDDRYAFVSNESVGATRGTLDVIDLTLAELVATAELHNQAGGISFWKMEIR